MNFADRVRGGLLGSVGLTFLIWTLIGTLKRVEDSLNFVWHVEQPRSFTLVPARRSESIHQTVSLRLRGATGRGFKGERGGGIGRLR